MALNLEELLRSLNENIFYAIIKSRFTYKRHGIQTGDIDILIDSSDSFKLSEYLIKFGFIKRLANLANPFEEYYIHPEAGILFHVHFELVIRKDMYSYQIIRNDMSLQKRVFEEDLGLYFVPKEIELLTHLAKIVFVDSFSKQLLRGLYYRRFLSPSISTKIDEILKSNDSFLHSDLGHIKILDLLFERNIIKKSIPIDAQLSLLSLFRLRRILRMNIQIVNRENRSLKKSGIHIGVVGIDGSGKSTLSGALVDHFSAILSSKRYYLGLEKGSRMLFVERLFGVLRRLRFSRKTLIWQFIEGMKWLYVAKQRRKKFYEIKRLNKSGFLTVSDRYPLKEFWDMEHPMDGPRISKWASRFNFVQKIGEREKSIYQEIEPPELIICLNISLEKAYERHTDGYEDLSDKYQAVTNLTRNVKHGLHVIDVDDLTPAEVRDRAIRIVSNFIR